MTAGLGAPVAVAKGVGAAAVGVSVAGNAYGSALKDGYSIGQARAYSTLVGAAEGLLQYILGGIGSLGGVTDDLIKAKINMIDNSLLRIAAKLGVDGSFEVTEEELQNFLEPAFRSIIFGEVYDAPTINEMLETAVVTAGTTLLLGGGDTVRSDLSENIQLVESGQKIMGTDGGLDMLMNLANEVAGLSSAQMRSTLTSQIDKVSQNATARNVGQLYATVQTANNQAIASVKPEDIATGLRNKGISSKKADGIAEAIVARLNGQELTRPQRNLLSSALESSAVRDTISELLQKKSNGIDSVQNDVYDNSNIRDGLTNEERAASWNLSNPSGDVFSNYDDTTVTEDSPVHQPQNTSSEGKNESGTGAKKPYTTSRPSYGKGQVERVWEINKDPTGKVWDPSGAELIWDPTRPRKGQWDMGHRPEHKYSVWHQMYIDDLISLEEFLEWYRNPAHYRPELPSTNRSHKYE